MQGTIPKQGRAMLGKDLCDMSGAKGRQPDEYTVYNVMLPRKYHPDIQNNLFEKRAKVCCTIHTVVHQRVQPPQAIAQQLHGGSMDVDYDQLLAKRPDSEDAVFAWHQDMAYWPPLTEDMATATCWLAVTRSTKENGCMRFVPASHKEAQLRPHAPGRQMCR